MARKGIKNKFVSEDSINMTFCANCKTCPAINITKDSDTVIVGGKDEGYTRFTKEQFKLFVEEVKDGVFDEILKRNGNI